MYFSRVLTEQKENKTEQMHSKRQTKISEIHYTYWNSLHIVNSTEHKSNTSILAHQVADISITLFPFRINNPIRKKEHPLQKQETEKDTRKIIEKKNRIFIRWCSLMNSFQILTTNQFKQIQLRQTWEALVSILFQCATTCCRKRSWSSARRRSGRGHRVDRGWNPWCNRRSNGRHESPRPLGVQLPLRQKG